MLGAGQARLRDVDFLDTSLCFGFICGAAGILGGRAWNHILGGLRRQHVEPFSRLGFPGESFVVRVDRCRLLTARGDFHAGFDAQVLGDARHNDP